MLFTLFVGLVVFTLIYVWLLLHRQRQLWLEDHQGQTSLDLAIAERRAEADRPRAWQRDRSPSEHRPVACAAAASTSRSSRMPTRCVTRQYVIPAYVAVVGSVAAFAAYTVVRGRRLARRRPPRGQAVDLTPRTVTDLERPAPPRRRRGWAPALVLALVLAGVAVLLFQFLRSASLYFCNADEVGQKSSCRRASASACRARRGPRQLPVRRRHPRLQHHLQRRQHPRALPGRRAERSFQVGRPAVVEGRMRGRHVRRRPDPREARQRVQGQEPGPRPRHRAVTALAPMNGALGMAGVASASPPRVLGGHAGARRRAAPRRLVRSGTIYVWLVLAGAVLSVAAMERALITRDFSLAYVQQVGSPPRRRSTTSPRCGARSRARSCCGCSSSPATPRPPSCAFRRRLQRPARRLGAGRDVRRLGVLLPAAVRPGQPVRAGEPAPSRRRPRAQPAAAEPPADAVPPADPLPRLRRLHACRSPSPSPRSITGRVGEGWLLETRRWALFAWGFLTIGILLGGWWSYEVLGWGGVWAWDPVENASFLPWLTGTAYIHSVLVQERRGMLRVWNLSLLVRHVLAHDPRHVPHPLAACSTSVHAFSDGPIGAYLLGVLRPRRRRVARR